MIEQMIISGDWLLALLAFSIISVLTNLYSIFNPNSYTKKILAGKAQLRDNWTRFIGVISFAFFLYVVFYILEIVK